MGVLRGHRDDSTSESPNQGNFKALLDLRIDAGDIALDQHLKTCAKYATYIKKKQVKISCWTVSVKFFKKVSSMIFITNLKFPVATKAYRLMK